MTKPKTVKLPCLDFVIYAVPKTQALRCLIAALREVPVKKARKR